jgi:predicted TIM-barrel fold metal-dependent hydrolase
MNKLGVSRSVLSITSPGTHLKMGDATLAARVTRETNEEMSQISKDYPDRFSYFASLPLPEIEASIAEIDYTLDHLGAVGFALMTNTYGIYLGDSSLEPVFAKLNQRRAIVFMHPTQCHTREHPTDNKPLHEHPTPMLEFLFDTTRAVANLLLTGTAQRYPDITFVVPHGGAVIPPVVERFTNFASGVLAGENPVTSADVKNQFGKQFYFDLAGFAFPDLIHGTLRISHESKLLYGTDFPFTPARTAEKLAGIMDMELGKMFDEQTIEGIYSGNAKRLFLEKGFTSI